jgi:hypothetical protein
MERPRPRPYATMRDGMEERRYSVVEPEGNRKERRAAEKAQRRAAKRRSKR